MKFRLMRSRTAREISRAPIRVDIPTNSAQKRQRECAMARVVREYGVMEHKVGFSGLVRCIVCAGASRVMGRVVGVAVVALVLQRGGDGGAGRARQCVAWRAARCRRTCEATAGHMAESWRCE